MLPRVPGRGAAAARGGSVALQWLGTVRRSGGVGPLHNSLLHNSSVTFTFARLFLQRCNAATQQRCGFLKGGASSGRRHEGGDERR